LEQINYTLAIETNFMHNEYDPAAKRSVLEKNYINRINGLT